MPCALNLCLMSFLVHPDDSAIGWGVTDWYQRHGYRELG